MRGEDTLDENRGGLQSSPKLPGDGGKNLYFVSREVKGGEKRGKEEVLRLLK